MRIGSFEAREGLFLAPLAGYTDLSFRRVCASFGAEYAVTEMISAKAVVMKNKKTLSLARLAGPPTAVQLFGAEPETVAAAAAFFSSEEGEALCGARPAAIDLNFGCPMKKIVSNGEGAALMRDPVLAGRVIAAAVRTSSLPVTVKIRAGWDGEHKNAPEIARVAEASGAVAVTVHARTREQFYTGSADLAVIAETAAAVRIPVLGNGDIRSPEDASRMLRETGCAGLVIGRGAVGRPWLFSEILAARRGEAFSPPGGEEIARIALAQFADMLKEKGERVGVSEARKHLCAYLAGFPGSAAARARVNLLDDPAAIAETLLSVLAPGAGAGALASFFPRGEGFEKKSCILRGTVL